MCFLCKNSWLKFAPLAFQAAWLELPGRARKKKEEANQLEEEKEKKNRHSINETRLTDLHILREI